MRATGRWVAASWQAQLDALESEHDALVATVADAVDLLELATPDVSGAIALLDGEDPVAITRIAAVKTTIQTDAATGISITHGLTLQNGDVLVAVLGMANDYTSVVSSGWTNDVENASATGSDRTGTILHKVITNAGSEPSSYTFTYSGSTTVNANLILIQYRGVDTTNPIDGTPTEANGSDDFTPDQVNHATVTDGAVQVIAHIAVDVDGALGSKTAGAPSGYTLVDSQLGNDGTGADVFLEVAEKTIATAGAQSIGAWTGSPDDAASEYITLAIALKPAAQEAENDPEPEPEPEPEPQGDQPPQSIFDQRL